jgi:hypothetical protein
VIESGHGTVIESSGPSIEARARETARRIVTEFDNAGPWRIGDTERDIAAAIVAAAQPSIDALTRVICAEVCAFNGELPCFESSREKFPPASCDEPGCRVLAEAVARSLGRTS